jgi:hypothetical protein
VSTGECLVCLAGFWSHVAPGAGLEGTWSAAAVEAAGLGRAREEVKMAEKALNGIRVAILVTDNFEESELVEPRKALDEAGA